MQNNEDDQIKQIKLLAWQAGFDEGSKTGQASAEEIDRMLTQAMDGWGRTIRVAKIFNWSSLGYIPLGIFAGVVTQLESGSAIPRWSLLTALVGILMLVYGTVSANRSEKSAATSENR